MHKFLLTRSRNASLANSPPSVYKGPIWCNEVGRDIDLLMGHFLLSAGTWTCFGFGPLRSPFVCDCLTRPALYKARLFVGQFSHPSLMDSLV